MNQLDPPFRARRVLWTASPEGLVLLFVLALFSQQPPRPGAALVPGLQLVYTSGADTQPVWTIDSVDWNRPHEGRGGCSRVVLRTGAPAVDVRWLCRSGDTLLSWTARNKRWSPQRPLSHSVTLILPRPNGGHTTYDVAAVECDVVGDARIATVVTTIVQSDSAGRAVRRLRERYAPSLATATGGIFEVRNGDTWEAERNFKLVALRYPAGASVPRECN